MHKVGRKIMLAGVLFLVRASVWALRSFMSRKAGSRLSQVTAIGSVVLAALLGRRAQPVTEVITPKATPRKATPARRAKAAVS
ncbi:MAG: hypothetical protein SGJ24_08550 [Chloroflexota bacterium]|nr:hypothetical protein [Chloroflexota bacterium]